MTNSNDASMAALQQEWLLLQRQHETYEGWAMFVKLAAVGLLALAPLSTALLAVLILLLWVMEAVLKTFQSRLGERLLRVERLLRRPEDGGAMVAMQLHSEWQTVRPGGAAMLGAYLRSACRPTVAFPYPVLMALLLWLG